MIIFKAAFILLNLLASARAWKTCNQTFCGKIRQSPVGYPRYALDLTTLTINPTLVEGTLLTDDPFKTLKFSILSFTQSFFVEIKEPSATIRRIKIPTLQEDLELQYLPLTVKETTSNSVTLESANTKAIIYGKPFKIEFYSGEKLVSILNPRDRFVYEFGRNGATAIDLSFIGAQRAYGLPLHAEHLSLRNTGPGGLDPYRLYNVNNKNYKIKSTEALHGAIPVIFGHGTTQSSGASLFYTMAQTWVDVTIDPNQVDAFFMSEDKNVVGSLVVVVLTGPSLEEAVQQTNLATSSRTYLAPYFALGYHQSSQSYITQREVLEVAEEFDKSRLPLEAVWLDIDYTENNKMFTWDPVRFPNPEELLAQLAAVHRKIVVSIDPQVKAERGYFLHNNATINGYYVRNPGGSDYMGLARPGISGYYDFFNSQAIQYYASLISAKYFKNKNLFIWHTMNEPMVFENEAQENTVPADLEHFDGETEYIQHRVLHNGYGSAQVLVTHSSLLNRDYLRSFFASRSHSSYITNSAAVWTGDIDASWEYLAISFPMCLTEALAGISFCGADVGGSYGIPDDELYQRWYQAATWLPFFRAHSVREVPRREPYLYSQGIQSRIRTALYQRYSHIPVWYTLHRELSFTGAPVIRPITYHYPHEDDALSIDNQILVGANILAAPVLKQGTFVTPVYLPGGESEIWYNIDDNYRVLPGTGYHLLQVNLNSVPVFYRGGSIISRKDIQRQTTTETWMDPYTLYICLDKKGQATGRLYVDDFESLNYFLLKKYLYLEFSYINNTFTSQRIHQDADYDDAAGIGQMVILSPPRNIAAAKIIGKNDENYNRDIQIKYSKNGNVLIVSNILLSLNEAFKIDFLM